MEDEVFSNKLPAEVIRDIEAVSDKKAKVKMLKLEVKLDEALNGPDYHENKMEIYELRKKINKLIMKERTTMKPQRI